MEIRIRRARIEDLEAINELADEMHIYLADLYGLELSEQDLKEEHFDEGELGNTYVADSSEVGVVGYMSFSRGMNEWAGPNYELEHIVVREDHRGSGVARRLFEVLLERARGEGVNITTGTLTKNERALRFYEGLGFKPLSVGLLLDLQKRILEK